jgi:D-sedoheptulose 7-phosphate isomerase
MSLNKDISDTKGFIKNYFEYNSSIMQSLDYSALEKFVDLILSSREKNQTIFFIGNGGSASTATHFVNDITLGSRQFEDPFRCISLCDNQACITAIGNDDGYENIFLQQLQTLFKPGDILVAISASGNSQNLLDAADWIKTKDGYMVGLTSFDGGILKEKSDLNIHVPAVKGEYGPAEDIHMMICGLVGTLLRIKFGVLT